MRWRVTGAGLLMTAFQVCLSAASPVTIPHLPASQASYRIKLESFVVAPTRTLGLSVKVHINGGPQFRLLLDSGSQYVVLDRKSAARSGCAGGNALELVGVGSASATLVNETRAQSLQVGDLTLRDVPLVIADRKLGEGIQGVLPLALFADFLIRLDIPGKELALSPYPTGQLDQSGALRAVSNNRLLFLRGTVNEAYEGYFLLDTGASYTAISHNMAQRLKISEMLAPRVGLQGGTAAMDAPLLTGSVNVRFESGQLADGPVVAVDLSTSSRYHQMEISGLIGYPALCNRVLTVNYRDGLVRIGPK
jgi:predicted aspartyl protease